MENGDDQGTYDESLYSEDENASFGVWVELGARDPEQQRFLDVGLSRKWERREPSGSGWVIKLLRDPIRTLMQAGVPGVDADSLITTTILHHHRGLEKKIIRVTVTVEDQSHDVAIEIDKETRDSD